LEIDGVEHRDRTHGADEECYRNGQPTQQPAIIRMPARPSANG
jgi:hypothetical protein